MAKRLTIKTLLDAGHRQGEVAELTSVSERTVRRVDRESVPTTLDDAVARAARRIGRPSKVSAVRDKVTALLAAEPLLPSTEVYRRMKLEGYSGKKSALFALLAEARPASPPAPLVRFEGLPGEFCQHDFGHVDVRFIDGSKL
jgi:transposase